MEGTDAARQTAVRRGGREVARDPPAGAPELQVPTEAAQAGQARRDGGGGGSHSGGNRGWQ